jgi:hypothetical protein
MAVTTIEPSISWRVSTTHAARSLAAIAAAGALLGLLVGGVGGRLAMMVRMNPRATGVTSDDGFSIGQLTLAGSLNLLLVGALLGALGAAVYAVLRALMIGPRWFKVVSISVGPAIVVGEQLVHVNGVDFTFLQPAWLAIVMFVLIPGVYAALLTVVAERWMAPDHFFARGPLPLALAPLLVFLPVAPLLAAIAVGWFLLELARRRSPHGAVPGATAVAWAARVALAAVFCFALVSLVEETLLLT